MRWCTLFAIVVLAGCAPCQFGYEARYYEDLKRCYQDESCMLNKYELRMLKKHEACMRQHNG